MLTDPEKPMSKLVIGDFAPQICVYADVPGCEGTRNHQFRSWGIGNMVNNPNSSHLDGMDAANHRSMRSQLAYLWKSSLFKKNFQLAVNSQAPS